MVEPARRRIDESGGIQRPDEIGQLELRLVVGDLAPAFVIDNLK